MPHTQRDIVQHVDSTSRQSGRLETLHACFALDRACRCGYIYSGQGPFEPEVNAGFDTKRLVPGRHEAASLSQPDLLCTLYLTELLVYQRVNKGVLDQDPPKMCPTMKGLYDCHSEGHLCTIYTKFESSTSL